MNKLNLLGAPVTPDHHSNSIKHYCHAVLVTLAQRINAQVGQQETDVAAVSLDSEEPLPCLIVDMKVSLDVCYAGPNRGGVQDGMDQGANVLGIVLLAKV